MFILNICAVAPDTCSYGHVLGINYIPQEQIALLSRKAVFGL